MREYNLIKLDNKGITDNNNNNFSVNENIEEYNKIIKKNIDFFNKRKKKIIKQTIISTRKKLELMKQDTSIAKIYDDDLVQNIAEHFTDRFKVFPLIGDIIRAMKLYTT